MGRSSSSGASGSTTSTNAPVMAPDHPLVAPAMRLSELRENEPPTGKAPETAEARLATPWLTISRLAFHGSRSAAAKVRAMAAGSAKPTSAMTAAGSSRLGAFDHGKSRLKGMNPPSRSPTLEPA